MLNPIIIIVVLYSILNIVFLAWFNPTLQLGSIVPRPFGVAQ